MKNGRGYLSLTVDDCEDSSVEWLLNKTRLYKTKYTFAIPTAFAGKIYKGRKIASWSLLDKAAKSGHSIASHSVNHSLRESFQERLSRGWEMLKNNDQIDLSFITSRFKYIYNNYQKVSLDYSLTKEVQASKAEIEKRLHVTCTDFYTPGGVINPNLVNIVKWSGYENLRTSKNGFNNPANFSPYDLHVKVWDRFTTADIANKWIDQAHKNNLWVIEVFHFLSDTPVSLYSASTHEILAHLKYANKLGICIDTVETLSRQFLSHRREADISYFAHEGDQKSYFLGSKSFYLFSEIVPKLSKKPLILNLGSGDGANLLSLRQELKGKDAILVGTDISLDKCRTSSRLLNLPALWADSRNLNFIDKSFDVVTDRNTLAFLEDDVEFLLEQNRILKMGGYLILSATMKNNWAIYFYKNRGQYVLDPAIVTTYTNKLDVLNLLKLSGFKVLATKVIPLRYPVIDLILRIFEMIHLNPFKDASIFTRHRFLNWIRETISLPIPNFWKYEVLAKKITHLPPRKAINLIKRKQYKLTLPQGASEKLSDYPYLLHPRKSVLDFV